MTTGSFLSIVVPNDTILARWTDIQLGSLSRFSLMSCQGEEEHQCSCCALLLNCIHVGSSSSFSFSFCFCFCYVFCQLKRTSFLHCHKFCLWQNLNQWPFQGSVLRVWIMFVLTPQYFLYPIFFDHISCTAAFWIKPFDLNWLSPFLSSFLSSLSFSRSFFLPFSFLFLFPSHKVWSEPDIGTFSKRRK